MNLMRARPDWNVKGPQVAPWFRRALARLDKRLVLQFVPARRIGQKGGMNAKMFPKGAWIICRRLRRSRYLHPAAVWSLVDDAGNPASPGADTIRVLRIAMAYHRNNQWDRLERLVDDFCTGMNTRKQDQSMNMFRAKMKQAASILGSRQWNNRVFLRRETALPSAGALVTS